MKLKSLLVAAIFIFLLGGHAQAAESKLVALDCEVKVKNEDKKTSPVNFIIDMEGKNAEVTYPNTSLAQRSFSGLPVKISFRDIVIKEFISIPDALKTSYKIDRENLAIHEINEGAGALRKVIGVGSRSGTCKLSKVEKPKLKF